MPTIEELRKQVSELSEKASSDDVKRLAELMDQVCHHVQLSAVRPKQTKIADPF